LFQCWITQHYACIVYVWRLCGSHRRQWQFRYGSLFLWCKSDVFLKMTDCQNFLLNLSNLEFLSRYAVTGLIYFSKCIVILLLQQWLIGIFKRDTELFLGSINRIVTRKYFFINACRASKGRNKFLRQGFRPSNIRSFVIDKNLKLWGQAVKSRPNITHHRNTQAKLLCKCQNMQNIQIVNPNTRALKSINREIVDSES
jgi:hypothetical protein